MVAVEVAVRRERYAVVAGNYSSFKRKDAWIKRAEARQQLASCIDSRQVGKAEKAVCGNANSFRSIARKWLAKFKLSWVASRADKIIRRLERDVFPGSVCGPLAASPHQHCDLVQPGHGHMPVIINPPNTMLGRTAV